LSPFLWLGLGACTPVCAQHWPTEQARELAALVRLIDTDSLFTDWDWSALGADLEGKDIVLIGEPDHG
jgi:erythromycin esterase-like protein